MLRSVLVLAACVSCTAFIAVPLDHRQLHTVTIPTASGPAHRLRFTAPTHRSARGLPNISLQG